LSADNGDSKRLQETLDKIDIHLSSASKTINTHEYSIKKLEVLLDIADENGLFKEQNEVSIETILESLRNARQKLQQSPPDIGGSRYDLSIATNSYYKATQKAGWLWRFSNLHGANVLIYLLLMLSGVFFFYYFQADRFLVGTLNVDSIAINATTWGVIGGILRGISKLWFRVDGREFRNVWKVYFVSCPFLGGIFGAIVYLLLAAGIITVSSQPVEGVLNPFVIMLFSAFSGFSWEWAVKQFTRIGNVESESK
jgi:hypothetical protein